jgi:hypothetical protein
VSGGVTTPGDCGTLGSASRDDGSGGVTGMGAALAGACRCVAWNARPGVRAGERITGSGCAGTRKAVSTWGFVSTARDVPRCVWESGTSCCKIDTIAATVSTAATSWDQDARTGWRRTSQANRVADTRGRRGNLESNYASTVATTRCGSLRCRRSVPFGCITRHLDCSILWRIAAAPQPRRPFSDDAGDPMGWEYRGWIRKVQARGTGVRG